MSPRDLAKIASRLVGLFVFILGLGSFFTGIARFGEHTYYLAARDWLTCLIEVYLGWWMWTHYEKFAANIPDQPAPPTQITVDEYRKLGMFLIGVWIAIHAGGALFYNVMKDLPLLRMGSVTPSMVDFGVQTALGFVLMVLGTKATSLRNLANWPRDDAELE